MRRILRKNVIDAMSEKTTRKQQATDELNAGRVA